MINQHLKQQVYAASVAVANSEKYDGLMFITTNGFIFGNLDEKAVYKAEYNIIRLKNAHIKVNNEKLLTASQISLSLEHVIALYPIVVQEQLDY